MSPFWMMLSPGLYVTSCTAPASATSWGRLRSFNIATLVSASTILSVCMDAALARMVRKVRRLRDQTTASWSARTVAARGELYMSASSPKEDPGWALPTTALSTV